jgi:peptidyl-prolyl cis-trans isomerase B (cyclophilin B)
MIQGGDPDGNGSGGGPRKLALEPSARKHERGVLSMARSQSLDSASCQFFIMHSASKDLDGKYSAFGQVVSGMYAVDRIVKTPRDQRDRPRTPQVIEKAFVLVAPADAAAWREPR